VDSFTTMTTEELFRLLPDPGAREELFRRWSPLLMQQVRALGASPADADDLVQAAMMQLWRSLESGHYKPELGPFPPYLRVIARNTWQDHLRRRHLRGSLSLDAMEPDVADAVLARDDGLDEVIQREEHQLLAQAVGQLDEKERQIFNWYLDGQSTTAIATNLGCSRSQAWNLIQALREKLRLLIHPTPPPTSD
jgi:RNA polymerase sigma factor (sigma-70 family)